MSHNIFNSKEMWSGYIKSLYNLYISNEDEKNNITLSIDNTELLKAY